MTNSVNWFEIPATDFQRAKSFYAMILGKELYQAHMAGYDMAFLQEDMEGVGGAVVAGPQCVPSKEGSLIYP